MHNKHTFDALRFLREAHIDYTTEGAKATKNRVNIHCPFCEGSQNYHLGIHLTNAYGHCWRCGAHSLPEIVHTILRVTWKEVYNILEDYKNVRNVRLSARASKGTRHNKLVLPDSGVMDLTKLHKQYIRKRNYNVNEITDLWKIQSTGPVGKNKHRIYIPIMYMEQPVSYQCRTIQPNVDLRYITCKPEHEKMFHKNTLYGVDHALSDTLVVVEGITDVWRLGPGAVATFGTSYTTEQMLQIARYSNVFILFDPEIAAQKKANKLANEVAMINKGNVHIITLDDTDIDPGDLPQDEADQLMHDILTH